jgi:putative restriction endonuclease
LVESAHILPVGAPESTDDVRNGIALSPTYHRAYDTGLIYLDEHYVMRLNPQKKVELVGLKLESGLKEFTSPLGKILLPQDKRQWPDITLIRKANAFRRIT